MERRKPNLERLDQHKPQPLDVYQVLVECRDEDEQRELFERLRNEGRKVRLLVL